MNENINLCEVLKDCPKGTKLYSSVLGEVYFNEITNNDPYAIKVKVKIVGSEKRDSAFTASGRYLMNAEGECVLFPSKEQRDWSKWKCPKPKFDPKTLKPFDKVLTGEFDRDIWYCGIFSHMFQGKNCMTIDHIVHEYCIPYNNDTKHLVGTTGEAPEYYRYWED